MPSPENKIGLITGAPLSTLKIDESNWNDRCQHSWSPARGRRGTAEDGSCKATAISSTWHRSRRKHTRSGSAPALVYFGAVMVAVLGALVI
jgi:hypothetical protein